jgi:hypothetical protein
MSSPLSSLAEATRAARRHGFLLAYENNHLGDIQGLLDALITIRAGFDRAIPHTDAATLAAVRRMDLAIDVLQVLVREIFPGANAPESASGSPGAGAPDPWTAQEKAMVAVQFGVKFDVLRAQSKPLFGPIYQARLLAALAEKATSTRQVPYQSRTLNLENRASIHVEESFYREAYQTGRLSLSVALADAAVAPEMPARPLTGSQPHASLNAAVARLDQLGIDQLSTLHDNTASARLTHLMSMTVEGLANFVLSAVRLPAVAQTFAMPALQTLRHVHTHVGTERPHGMYFEVTAFIQTANPNRDACLSFALRIDAKGQGVAGFSRAMEMRVVPLAFAATSDAMTSRREILRTVLNAVYS